MNPNVRLIQYKDGSWGWLDLRGVWFCRRKRFLTRWGALRDYRKARARYERVQESNTPCKTIDVVVH